MIDILLPTFNGEAYLGELLRSIRAQDNDDWRLYLLDDRSCDNTVQVVEECASLFGERLVFCGVNPKNSGLIQAFSALVAQSTGKYLMFCDQDDVWLPDKITRTLGAMQKAEAKFGADTPLLVHTDLQVVDANLKPLAPSFMRFGDLSPDLGRKLNRLLAQNVVTGCTVMINRPLARLAAPLPVEAAMHDWWLALVANLFGKVVYLDEPTLLYRQHGANMVGARKWGVRRMFGLLAKPVEVRTAMLQSMRQAQTLLECYGDRLSGEQAQMIRAYARLPYCSKAKRLQVVLRHRFFKCGLARTLGFMANICQVEAARS